MTSAQILDFVQASATRPDPRVGELLDRYMASIDRALEETLAPDAEAVAELTALFERAQD